MSTIKRKRDSQIYIGDSDMTVELASEYIGKFPLKDLIYIPNYIVASRTLSVAAKIGYAGVLSFVKKEQRYPTYDERANECGMKPRTAGRVLRELERKGCEIAIDNG